MLSNSLANKNIDFGSEWILAGGKRTGINWIRWFHPEGNGCLVHSPEMGILIKRKKCQEYGSTVELLPCICEMLGSILGITERGEREQLVPKKVNDNIATGCFWIFGCCSWQII